MVVLTGPGLARLQTVPERRPRDIHLGRVVQARTHARAVLRPVPADHVRVGRAEEYTLLVLHEHAPRLRDSLRRGQHPQAVAQAVVDPQLAGYGFVGTGPSVVSILLTR